MNPYEQALRECLLDFEAMAEEINGRQNFATRGQWQALIRAARQLRNREDCPQYDYKKGGA